MSDRGKLGSFLKEIIDWTWADFCKAEQDSEYKGYEGVIFSLVRACSSGKLSAIKTAISRVDGNVETPIKIEYPKVFLLFPEATTVALPPATNSTKAIAAAEDFDELPEEPEEEKVTAATMSLRETLEKMVETPRKVPKLILHRKEEVEQAVAQGRDFSDDKHIPLVKSVIAANLLTLAEGGKFEAITEVFDQIDGKLVETIRVLGEDMYLNSYMLEAPHGARKNKDGVYYIEAPQVTEIWKEKLGQKHER